MASSPSSIFSLLILLICGHITTASSSFSVEVDYCSGSADYAFTLLDASIDCSGGCSWGSSAQLSGVFEIQDELATMYPNVTIKAWARTLFSDTINLCSSGNLTSVYSNDTATCPESGIYEFSTYTTLPQPTAWKFTSNLYITVSTLFDFYDEDVVCTLSVISSNSFTNRFSSNDNSSFIASGAILLAGFAVHGFRKRRRRIAAEDNCDDIHASVMSRFDLMTNSKATP